mmetsp:Transcript_101416/g.295493  ORF Transcript_101416/g.295493 Transcript_101416/m.295493 type:complete len:234 (-) Transcript_101416:472-1173(-)
MVIPMGGDVPLMGPPPPELLDEFKKVKYCLIAMMASMMAKLASGTLLFGFLSVLGSCLNLCLNSLMGFFLLRDDPSISKIYAFLATNCFQSCGLECTGGLVCLVPFFLCNLMTFVLDVLLGPTLTVVFKEAPALVQPRLWPSPVGWLANLVFTMADAGALLAQGCAAHYSWQAYKLATASVLGGSDVTYMPLSGGHQLGGVGGADSGLAPQDPAPVQQTRRPFSGHGQRLGVN